MGNGGAGPTPGAGEWRPRYNAWLVAVSVMLGTFMEVLDTSVANVALPHIAGSLSATPSEATWVLTSYLVRSEEHTSELQSQSNLVCRLLLEKKKTSTY